MERRTKGERSGGWGTKQKVLGKSKQKKALARVGEKDNGALFSPPSLFSISLSRARSLPPSLQQQIKKTHWMLCGTVCVHPPTVSPATGTSLNPPGVATLKLLKTEEADESGFEGALGPEIMTPMLLGSSVTSRVPPETAVFGTSLTIVEFVTPTTSDVPMTAA